MWVAASVALKFATSPAGRLVLIALAFLAWGTYQRIDATSDCKDAQLQEELEEAQRQNAIAARIAAEARARADLAEAETAKLKEIADAIEKDIMDDPDRGCVIGPADLERLRSIK